MSTAIHTGNDGSIINMINFGEIVSWGKFINYGV